MLKATKNPVSTHSQPSIYLHIYNQEGLKIRPLSRTNVREFNLMRSNFGASY